MEQNRRYVGTLVAVAAAAACIGSTATAVQYTLTTLATFNGTNGSIPLGGLIADAGGNLYGTTDFGGANDLGSVFKVAAGTHALSTLASFDGTNGRQPFAGLIADASGNLYGTTTGGGYGGTVFKVAAGTHALSTLATFNNGSNGGYPEGALLADASGNLYGTTSLAGANGDGTVFKVAAGTHALTTLASFNGTNGDRPVAGLIADASGNLYGTTVYGGDLTLNNGLGAGTVFKLAAGTNALTALAKFNGLNGAIPQGGLLADANGNFYGTTSYGGFNNDGVVFKVAAGTNSITALDVFYGTNGDYPNSGLIADASGNLYGTTYYGGPNGMGTVFTVDAITHVITTLVSFNGTNGASPNAGLLADASGNLYGTTAGSGGTSMGTVFELSPVATVAGDYNGNGVVDAADYTWWRKNNGTAPAYTTWRSNFGHPAGSGSFAGGSIPEPASLTLAAFVLMGGLLSLPRHT